jgi:uncharacterized protein GlcG (DUF336 family)
MFGALSLILVAAAWAQQPPPGAPAGGPPQPSPPYGAPITLEQAKRIVAAAEAEAAKSKESGVVIAIVQPSGELVLFEKMDASTYVSIQFAQMKARMAARYRNASGNLPPNGGNLPDAIGLPGGLPIVYQGKTIGAIGVSGAEHGGDTRVGQAGIDALNGK